MTSLSHYLAQAGVASRRKSTEIIKLGLVEVNGRICREPGFKVSADDVVCYEAQTLKIPHFHYIMLNKPPGYTCTSCDRFAEKTVFDLVDIPGIRLFSAGRLDKDSEGLIILTNDGDFALHITHPRYKIIKRYEVATSCHLSEESTGQLLRGIHDDGEHLRAIKIIYLSDNLYEFHLNEGRKREIRRMIRWAGSRVMQLKRVAIGPLTMGMLELGKWRELSEQEIAYFRQR